MRLRTKTYPVGGIDSPLVRLFKATVNHLFGGCRCGLRHSRTAFRIPSRNPQIRRWPHQQETRTKRLWKNSLRVFVVGYRPRFEPEVSSAAVRELTHISVAAGSVEKFFATSGKRGVFTRSHEAGSLVESAGSS